MRRVALILACVGAMLLVVSSPLASAAPPDATAWWGRLQTGLVPLPAPPDVAESDLLIEGVSGDPSGWLAVAALAFGGLDADAAIELGMRVETASGADGALACPLLETFTPAWAGPWADVPAHDCNRGVEGIVAGDELRFEGLDALADHGTLLILIVPASPGRLVVDGDARLTVHHAPAAPTPPPPDPRDTGAGAPPPSRSPATVAPAPRVIDEPSGSEQPTAAPAPSAAAPQPSVPRFAANDDRAVRLLTAASLFVLLGAFSLINAGGTTRLRPASLRWSERNQQD